MTAKGKGKQPVSAKYLADYFGLSGRRIQQLAKEGVIPRAGRGKYDFEASVKAYIRYLQKLAAGQGSLNLTDERTRLTKLQADKLILDIDEAEGRLINVETAMLLWSRVIKDIRSRLLAMPSKIAPLMIGCLSIAEAKDIIEKVIHEILSDLSNPDLRKNPRVAGDPPGARNHGAAPAAEGVRVG